MAHTTEAKMIHNPRVLIISPVATHPQNEGNFERVFQIVEAVKSVSEAELFFCHVKIPPLRQTSDITAMKDYWGENLAVFETAWHPTENALGLSRRTSRMMQSFRLLGKVGISDTFLERFTFLHSADMWFPPGLGDWLNKFSETWKPDVVIVEYALLSRAFDFVHGNPRRIIDTHDVFTERNQRLRKQGVGGDWISFTARQEKKLLQRADRVIAIQQNEAQIFRGMIGAQKVALVDVLAKPIQVRSCGEAPPVLGFLGSPNSVNRSALNWFLEAIWPDILKHMPQARLRVGGRIGENSPAVPGVEYIGEFDQRDAFYAGCRALINPCLGGTGLKIKSVEALTYGRPLVTTSHGGAGLEAGQNQCLFITDEAVGFRKHCRHLLEEPAYAEQMGRAAWDFVQVKRAGSLRVLAEVLIKSNG